MNTLGFLIIALTVLTLLIFQILILVIKEYERIEIDK
tara:strand:+ start:279 stop:389 length:111 start_codon:yes stop_codon:yes gene_type:complete